MNLRNFYLVRFLAYNFWCFLDRTCSWKQLSSIIKNKDNRGNAVGKNIIGTIAECKIHCDSIANCWSFTYNFDRTKCYMKDKIVSGSEVTKPVLTSEQTIYKTCNVGM